MKRILRSSFPVIALAILIFLLLVVITRAEAHACVAVGAALF
jgi:hypothetical protein